MTNKLYAQVVNGKIAATLTEEHIINSCKSFELFTEIDRSGKPENIGKYEVVVETFDFKFNRAFSVYTVKPMPIDVLLGKAHDLGPQLTSDVELVNLIRMTVDTLVTERLDNFAKERGYSSILSLAGYAGSEDPVFDSEGKTGKLIRERTNRALLDLLSLVMNGKREIPTTFAEIVSLLPALNWTEA